MRGKGNETKIVFLKNISGRQLISHFEGLNGLLFWPPREYDATNKIVLSDLDQGQIFKIKRIEQCESKPQ